MKITRWLLAAILFFKTTNLAVSLSLTHFLSPLSVSSLHISAMADNWFTVMAKGAAKKVLPTFHTPTAFHFPSAYCCPRQRISSERLALRLSLPQWTAAACCIVLFTS